MIKKGQNYDNVVIECPLCGPYFIFIFVFQHRWSVISSELQHVQAHLNEVLNNWQQWNSSYRSSSSHVFTNSETTNLRFFFTKFSVFSLFYEITH